MRMSDVPVSVVRRESSSRTWAWIVTSRAVVGSSAIISLRLEGERHRDHHALAHAAGELVREALEPRLGLRDPDHARAARSPARGPRPWASSDGPRIVSTICSSMVSTGLRLVIGSWKIIAMSRPRMSRIVRLAQRRRGPEPSNRTLPPSIRPAGLGSSRMIARLVTLLPQPDSPTRPSARRGSSVEDDAVDGVDRPVVGPEPDERGP